MKAHSTSDAARLAAVFTGLLLLASVPVAPAASATGPESAAGLQARSGSLEARAAEATLELYSLESQLGRARSELAGIAARREELARERASAQTQLTVARQALLSSQSELSNLARTLYQQSGSDPLAVLLGARSLDEAIAGLDGIARAAGLNNRIVEQARTARTRLSGLSARLAERDAELDGLAAAAEARAASLETTAAQRRGLIGELRRQQGLNAARIATIEAQARTAATRTTARAVASPPPALSPVEVTAPMVTPSEERTLTVNATGYTIRGRTSTGIPTAPGVVAVDPAVIPLGTRLTIPGYGIGIAADTGGAVHGNTIDVWFATAAQAHRWGRRTVTVTIH